MMCTLTYFCINEETERTILSIQLFPLFVKLVKYKIYYVSHNPNYQTASCTFIFDSNWQP